MSVKKLKFRQRLPPVLLSYLVPAHGVEGNYIVFKLFWQILIPTPLKYKFSETLKEENEVQVESTTSFILSIVKDVFMMSKIFFPD